MAAHALDLPGDLRALLVLRELLGGKRFQLLRAGLPASSVLTPRLAELEAGGLPRRVTLPDPAAVQVDDLIEPGRGVRPVIDARCRFVAEPPGRDPGKFISPKALMLSMAAHAKRRATREMAVTAGFDMGQQSFRGAFASCRWQISRGAAEGDLIFAGSANTLAAVIFGARPLVQWPGSKSIIFSGDPVRGQRFLALFRRGSGVDA